MFTIVQDRMDQLESHLQSYKGAILSRKMSLVAGMDGRLYASYSKAQDLGLTRTLTVLAMLCSAESESMHSISLAMRIFIPA